MISLDLYRVFYTVAKSGSLTKAAEELFISQPAISKSISKLEEELNITLFYRANKGISLTPSGELLYNYLAQESIDKLPKEKVAKLYTLLDVKEFSEIKKKKITGDYIIEIEKKIDVNEKNNNKDYTIDFKSFNRKEQEILNDIFNLLQEKLVDDKTKDTYNTYIYLYNFLQSMDNNKELKYILAYFSKALGFTDPHEFKYSENQQFIFESIMYSGMTLYGNGGASRTKIAETHKRFVQEIEHKKEEVRTKITIRRKKKNTVDKSNLNTMYVISSKGRSIET